MPHGATGNRLLDSIPREEFERLSPHLEWVELPQGEVLNEAGDLIRYVYFPRDGMVSLLSTTQAGETVEVAMVSSEGVVGVSVVLGADISPYRTSVQLPVNSLRVKSAVFKKELRADGQLQSLLLKFTHVLMMQISQSAVCNRFHKVEKRLCRWLLVARDHVDSKHLNLTQKILSEMLGTSRTIVTTAANSLQDAGLISYRRGKITLTDIRGMEASACECYQIVKKGLEYLIAA
jgi:CRP-like cAMP-binding protein